MPNNKLSSHLHSTVVSNRCNTYCLWCLFLQLYFETLFVSKNKGFFLKPFIQCGCIMVSLFFGLNRVREHMHSWTDISAGFALGAVMAIYMVCPNYWCVLFFAYFSWDYKSIIIKLPNTKKRLGRDHSKSYGEFSRRLNFFH